MASLVISDQIAIFLLECCSNIESGSSWFFILIVIWGNRSRKGCFHKSRFSLRQFLLLFKFRVRNETYVKTLCAVCEAVFYCRRRSRPCHRINIVKDLVVYYYSTMNDKFSIFLVRAPHFVSCYFFYSFFLFDCFFLSRVCTLDFSNRQPRMTWGTCCDDMKINGCCQQDKRWERETYMHTTSVAYIMR